MDYEEWEPIYLDILREFGYSRWKDENSAAILADLLRGKNLCLDQCLRERMAPVVTVCGDALRLPLDIDRVGLSGTVIAADGATTELMSRGIVPDLIVSDLDGEIEPQLEANERGAVEIIHCHGDNLRALKLNVPRFKGLLLGTTQARPAGLLRNFGGFTDGDRAVMLARHFGARAIVLLGFDFSSPKPKSGRDGSIKLRKLEWARKLIFDLHPPGSTCLLMP